MEDELDKILLNVIINVRKERDITREELAEAINFPLSTLNDIEGGRTKRIPGLFLLAASQFLGIDISRTLEKGKTQLAVDFTDIEDLKQDLKEIKGKLDRYDAIFFDEIEKKRIEQQETTSIKEIGGEESL